jgi:hypothetical protein
MRDEERDKAGDVQEDFKSRQAEQPGLQDKENFAEHLARVIADADHSKAFLQAQYKALHSAPPIASSARHKESGEADE